MRHATSRPRYTSLPALFASRTDPRSRIFVDSALRDMGHAAAGDDVAYYLSGAFSSVLRASSTGHISREDRSALQDALRNASEVAMHLPPRGIDPASLRAGFSALATVIAAWGEHPEPSAPVPWGRRADVRAIARILQNELHNASLREEIEYRICGKALPSPHSGECRH